MVSFYTALFSLVCDARLSAHTHMFSFPRPLIFCFLLGARLHAFCVAFVLGGTQRYETGVCCDILRMACSGGACVTRNCEHACGGVAGELEDTKASEEVTGKFDMLFRLLGQRAPQRRHV